MADKTPVRVVFNSDNVATGMAEFQTGETVAVSHGGTGLSSIGSSLQVLRVNAAGNALEFGTLEDLGDIGSIGSTLTAPSNADFTITTAGTGNIVLNDLTISDNSISTNRSNDDLKINASGSGTVVLENLKVGTGATVTTILDEDAMGSDSATSLATQQSIKAYVDTHDANIASDTLTFTNKTFDVEGTGNSISNIDVADLKSGVLDTDLSSVSGSDDTLASAKAIKSYVDSQLTASDLDFSTDDSTALSISLSTESLQFSGGSGISTRGSANTVTIDIDTGTVVTLSDSQNLTNKTLTSAILNTGVSGTAVLDEDNFASNSATQIATQQSIKAYVDTQDANIASDTLTLTNKTFDVEGTGNSISNIDVADFKAAAITTESEGIGSNDNDTSLPTSAAVKDYVDTQITAEDLDFSADDSTVLSIDLDSEVLHFAGGTGISTSVSNNTITHAIDTGTVVTLADSQTLTNKVLTNPTINAFSGTGNGSITGTLSIATTTTDDSFLVTTTEDSNSAAPVITLKRNSSSPADADYLGRIKFKGENDADQEVQYGSISGKILDASDGTEDGAIEFNVKKAGANNIAMRINSDELKLLNGTTLDVDGAGTFAGAVTSTSVTTNDIVSNGSNAELTIASSGTGDIILDAGGDVILDADNADVILKDDGTEFGRFSRVSSDFVIKSATNNKDIVFKGVDASATITALTLDMSEAGKATFNDTVIVGDNLELSSDSSVLKFGADGDTTLTHTDGTGLTLNSTNKLTFGDAATFIHQSADGVMTIDGEATIDLNASTAVLISNDLKLNSDSSVLGFGVNNEITLTHVHDTGLLLEDSGGTPTLQLHDANESIASDGSKVIITSGGTAFNLPTADGSSGQALITDGGGTLSFGTVAESISDDTLALVKNNKSIGTSAQTVDAFSESVTDAVHYVMVQNDITNERVSTFSFNVLHNNSDGFVGGIRGTGTHTANDFSTLTSDSSSNMIRLRLAGPSTNTKVSFYRVPLSTANTADGTRGNTVTTSNTDVDSASESIDSFAHASFRGAKYFILIDNNAKTETSCLEALVVHDGSNAFISTYGVVNSGNNDQVTLSATIDGSNVVVSAAGLEPNLNLTIHKILLSDSMTAAENENQKAIGATTVSSSSTVLDTYDLDTANGAVYYVVGANSTEGAFSIQEIYTAASFTAAAVGNGGFVSSKETSQLSFTGDFSTTAHNTYALSCSSTSGGSTTVNAYRINLKAE